MNFIPLRLKPGADLREVLDSHVFPDGTRGGFVVAGMGSLVDPKLRFAAAGEPTVVPGPVEIVAMSGSISENGSHVHLAVATATGEVLGGHLCHGSEVRTTVELLLAPVPDARLTREFDEDTGHAELKIRLAREPGP